MSHLLISKSVLGVKHLNQSIDFIPNLSIIVIVRKRKENLPNQKG